MRLRVAAIALLITLGCAHHEMAVVTRLPDGRPILFYIVHKTFLRQASYDGSMLIPGVGVAYLRGCDEKVSGNLGAIILGAAAIFAPPVGTGLAAAGLAAQEIASRTNVSHKADTCQVFVQAASSQPGRSQGQEESGEPLPPITPPEDLPPEGILEGP